MKSTLVSTMLAVLGPIALSIAIAWLIVPNDLPIPTELTTNTTQIMNVGDAR